MKHSIKHTLITINIISVFFLQDESAFGRDTHKTEKTLRGSVSNVVSYCSRLQHASYSFWDFNCP